MRETILKKIEDDEPLTPDERRFYLVEIVGMTPDEAERVMFRNDNEEEGVIID